VFIDEEHAGIGRQMPNMHQAASSLRIANSKIDIESVAGMSAGFDNEHVFGKRFIQ
jgi:hypothetical protein